MNPFRRPQITDELLSAYIDGAVTVEERKLIESAVDSNAEIAWRLDTLRQTVNLLRSLPDVALPRSFVLTEADVAPVRPAVSSVIGAARRVARPRYVEPEAPGFWQALKEFLQGGNPLVRNLATASMAVWLVLFGVTQLDLSRLVVEERNPSVLTQALPSVDQANTETFNSAGSAPQAVVTSTQSVVEPQVEVAVAAPASVDTSVQSSTESAPVNPGNDPVNEGVPNTKAQEQTTAAQQGTAAQSLPAQPAEDVGVGGGGASAPAAGGEFTNAPGSSAMRSSAAESGAAGGSATGGGEDNSGGLDTALRETGGNAVAFDAPVATNPLVTEQSAPENVNSAESTIVTASSEIVSVEAAIVEPVTVDASQAESATAGSFVSTEASTDTTSTDTTSTSQKFSADEARSASLLTETSQAATEVPADNTQTETAAENTAEGVVALSSSAEAAPVVTESVVTEPAGDAAVTTEESASAGEVEPQPAQAVDEPASESAVQTETFALQAAPAQEVPLEQAAVEQAPPPADSTPTATSVPPVARATTTPLQVASSDLPAQQTAPSAILVPPPVEAPRTTALLDPFRLQIAQVIMAVLTALFAAVWLLTHRSR